MFRNLPPVIKNLIILNALMLLAAWVLDAQFGISLEKLLGFHYFESKLFKPYQLVTYMFMHGGFIHLFFNMYALFIFGVMLESVWGSRKFFTYYILCGLGAIAIQGLVNYIQYFFIEREFAQLMTAYSSTAFITFVQDSFPNINAAAGSELYRLIMSAGQGDAATIFNDLMQFNMTIPTVGASGAVYGILLAFGMMFPNTQLMLLIPPIPIKAKWLVIIYGGLEFSLGITQQGSNIAHFAHLGGMIVGFILIRLWKKNTNINRFY